MRNYENLTNTELTRGSHRLIGNHSVQGVGRIARACHCDQCHEPSDKGRFVANLTVEQVNVVFETTSIITSFPADTQAKVRIIFGRGYNL